MPVPNENLIELEDVTRIYRQGERSHPVLNGVNLSIHHGERVALLGRSGSGKSTLLNLLAGIDQPDTGTVRIAGKELTGQSEKQRTLFRRRHIGFIYQFFNLVPTLTVAENIRLPMELNGMAEPHILERVRSLLDTVELTDRAGSFPDQLSGGEQQRIAILRAIAHEPDLVLADEPTGNLDRMTGSRALDLLEQLLTTRGATLLLVTHSLAVTRMADRVFTLDNGMLKPMAEGFAW